MNPRIHPSLLADMKLALQAEIGARVVYEALSRRIDEAELARVLDRFHQDEIEQVERLHAIMKALGSRARATSRRRTLMARLVGLAPILGMRSLALRLCQESETTIARWHMAYAAYLSQAGEGEHARACEALAVTKFRHARILEAWVPH